MRHDEPEARMLPARERLDAVDDPAALHERRFRLIVGNELVVRDAAAQVVRVELRALMQHRGELRLQVGDHDRFLEGPAHREPVAHAELVRGGQHALVGARQNDAGRAGARTERAQQLDAVGVRQVQVHHDQRRLKRLEQLHEAGARSDARDGVTNLACDCADEVGDSAILVHDQQSIDVVSHSPELEPRHQGVARRKHCSSRGDHVRC